MSSTTKLLFVDDEGPIRRLFHRAMGQDENILLETASDGKEALKKLKTFPADIVITDVKMPNMDGLTLSSLLILM
jgi:YesN/AraC family two-component response regulator